jgi:uncharacterized protein
MAEQNERGTAGLEAQGSQQQSQGQQSQGQQRRSNRGFASMDPSRQKEIASKGGKAAHAKGTAHEWTPDEARQAGRKGGEAVSRDRAHMAAIGREGGGARGRNARQQSQGSTSATTNGRGEAGRGESGRENGRETGRDSGRSTGRESTRNASGSSRGEGMR